MSAKEKTGKYSKPVKKLLINQFGAALLGIMMYTASSNSVPVNVFTSLFSICFYMVIIYTAMWDIGAADRVKVDGGRLTKDLFTGTKAALIAGIPNIILGVLCALFTLINGMADAVVVIARNIAVMWESMYSGLLWAIFPKTLQVVEKKMYYTYDVLENPTAFGYMSLYLVIVIPAIAAATLGYIAGYSNFKIVRNGKSN